MTPHEREVVEQALSALEYYDGIYYWVEGSEEEKALRTCLAHAGYVKKKEWVGLTDEEAKKTFEKHNCTISADLAGILARAITAKLKEKNT